LSTRVVLPWSTWAMMAIFRIFSITVWIPFLNTILVGVSASLGQDTTRDIFRDVFKIDTGAQKAASIHETGLND